MNEERLDSSVLASFTVIFPLLILFLLSIFGIFNFLKISRLFLVIGLFLFLTGFAYYLIASCDLIKMVKILYSVDEGKKQQTIADFEKELRK